MRLVPISLLALMPVASPVAAQPVTGDPDPTGVRLATGDLNRYEAMYGEPEFRSLDSPMDPPSDWPVRRSIRTVGEIHELPVLDARQEQRYGYEIRGEAYSLNPAPAEDLVGVWAAHMPFWAGERVEVVGAFDPRVAGGYFLVWEISLAPRGSEDVAASRTTLEDLVIDPQGFAGRPVTVVGTFRGSNLFGDMEESSRRGDTDWVLREGPFFIWVTGHPPKGDTFSLDPSSREDCRQRLEVAGEVRTLDGLIYLEATNIRLLGPAHEEPRE